MATLPGMKDQDYENFWKVHPLLGSNTGTLHAPEGACIPRQHRAALETKPKLPPHQSGQGGLQGDVSTPILTEAALFAPGPWEPYGETQALSPTSDALIRSWSERSLGAAPNRGRCPHA